MEIGIIGLPKSGKTTVFNALTRGHAEMAPYATTREKLHIGVAKVPDPRLNRLEAMYRPKRTVPVEVQYVDIPGAPEGLGKSSGIAGELLNRLQQSDALFHVVRAFQDPAAPHVEGSVDPYRDVANMNLELAFVDLGILERRSQRLEDSLKGAKGHQRDLLVREQEALGVLKDSLEQDVPLREQQLTSEAYPLLENYQLLTAKPLLVVFNIGEEQLPQTAELEAKMGQRLARSRVGCTTLCGKLEMELTQMDTAEELEFRESLGIGEAGSDRVIRLSYDLLGLISFFTTVSDEVRAWTVPRGTVAVKAAGKIHTDMERGFIRAEVAAFDDLQRCGSIAELRKQGLLRMEGKPYPIQDGDIVTFHFNVPK